MAILIGQLVAIVVLVLVAWGITVRSTPVHLKAMGWGIVAFPLSQVARFAVVVPLSLMLDSSSFWLPVLLVITSGVFEETVRWLVIRYGARSVRDWWQGLGFGLGYGGSEALLLIGGSALSSVMLLATAPTFLPQLIEQDPASAAQIEEQIAALESVTIWLAGLGVYERILAIVFHIAMSVLIIRAVLERRWLLWLIAVVVHCGFNAVAVGLSESNSLWAVYAALTATVLILVLAMWRGPLSTAKFTVPGKNAQEL